ncbi:MAG: helix-turn-helix domain-containing protein [Myxococcales bacterium]|nr:helix-turn-helix domain-containing protein [Myxococcales bacterium]
MDADACYRAIETRDARFAGRFFLGVKTTRIYCRPGCPARLPRRENVEFFASAAAAETAGFRACLRCRPDAAPGSPAQAGTAATLSRALRLLEESGETTGLADRLGVTDRHLRRLFARHLGATPAAVLRTRRLHLARQLLESSVLPMIDVAQAAGFRSLRRFNEAMKHGFGKTPSALRKQAGPRAALTLRVAFHAPLDFEKLLDFFEKRALPGIEEVRDGSWRRTLREGVLEVRRGGPDHLRLEMPAALAPHALQIVARVQRVFDLRADPHAIHTHLSRDAGLKPFVKAGVRVPGAWDPFEMAVRAILGQQISVQRARALADELVEAYGETLPHGRLFPEPAALAQADLRGMPGVRARAIPELAKAALDGRVRLDGSQPLEDAVAALREVPGVGDWTAQLIALRALGEPDAFPAADLGLCHALQLSPREIAQRAESWRPWRAYAAAAIWLS